MRNKQYIAIDLKSFYASVECVDRGLDPLEARLVVADVTKTSKTICLAVSPALKKFGIGGRARLFEVEQVIKQENYKRQKHGLEKITFEIAPPRMARYIEVSAKIYSTYLRFVCSDDVHVYSIDEVFIDATKYLGSYKITAHELARRMVQAVLDNTGITATVGIGTNLYLAKVAMDIVAKHLSADKDGVRIAELDEISYRKLLWSHKPLTDFWRFGNGIVSRLFKYNIDTMGRLARFSIKNSEILYREFGVNAELIIDHAWGIEPCTIEDIKSYKPSSKSLCSGQVLTQPYTCDKAKIVVKEMIESLILDIVSKNLVTNQVVLSIGYDIDCLKNENIKNNYKGEVVVDHYGRLIPKPTHGTITIGRYTSSTKKILEEVCRLYDNIVIPFLLVRRISMSVNHLVKEDEINKTGVQLNLFEETNLVDESKERRLQEVQISIKSRFGKNSLLRGLNFEDGATARERNKQIGGHKA